VTVADRTLGQKSKGFYETDEKAQDGGIRKWWNLLSVQGQLNYVDQYLLAKYTALHMNISCSKWKIICMQVICFFF
jgi:hypothetical protein